MKTLGVQYYRPPFPEKRYWEEDFKKIKDCGLDTVQLWFLWGWIEPKPDHFIFNDFDTLIELADKYKLGVVPSTVAEIQPCWIHRVAQGSEMMTNMGHKVISSSRGECHVGITPGGCFDHPGVWQRMENFLTRVVTRYRSAGHVRAWDAWNELRWNVNADGLVCYCGHTLKSFRAWLDDMYGGLEGLNQAWKRRYARWDEVMPGKIPGRRYSINTEHLAFAHFMQWRSAVHAKARYDVIKNLDPDRPVTCHGARPTPLEIGDTENTSLNRGNDWDIADYTDGIGCSSFPIWEDIKDIDFAIRLNCVSSAAGSKKIWLSELQGGQAADGYTFQKPVGALSQQRWLWNGIAEGAETILFWCWRDEVFGQESGGFGLNGNDGFAGERLNAMKITSSILKKNRSLLENYKLTQANVGVLFSSSTYFMNWAQQGDHQYVQNAIKGYLQCLTRQSIPYIVVEEKHLEKLNDIKILFMPRILITSEATEQILERFVRTGGTLVCESECGAFSPEGFYRYPEDRFTSRLSGIREIGRRAIIENSMAVTLDNTVERVGITQWITPWQAGTGNVLAYCDEGAFLTEVPVDKGKLVLCSSYLGQAYSQEWTRGFDRLIRYFVRQAEAEPDFEVLSPKPQKDSFVYVKTGQSCGKRLFFIFFGEYNGKTVLKFNSESLTDKLTDIITGRELHLQTTSNGLQLEIKPPDLRLAVLIESTESPCRSQ